MGLVVPPEETNRCVRGCCRSAAIPLHLPSASFSLLSPIARGSESTVYEAQLAGERVAAKKPVLSTSEDLDKFHYQLQLLCELDHPGLAKLIAAHAHPPNYLMFFDFFEPPNLADKIHVEEWSPSVQQVVAIASDLGPTKALQYLHILGVVHRDIKPANILLDKDLHPHLADFGLAMFQKDIKRVSVENWKSSGKPTGGFHKKNMVGTLIYMAPEILRKDIHTERSDVYSFAISINELLTGVVPYTDLRAEAQAHTVLEMTYTEQQLTAAVVSQGLRPALALTTSGVPSVLLSLIQRCWDPDPEKRPSFENIIDELNIIQKHLVSSACLPSSPVSKSQNGNIEAHHYKEALNWFNQGKLFVKRSEKSDLTENLWSGYSNQSSEYRPTLSWGSFATCGRRETMEDTHFMLPHVSEEKDIFAFGIFDGHRGSAAAEFSVRAVPGFLKQFGQGTSPIDTLAEAFVRTDIAFREELILHQKSKRIIRKDWHPGCTAVTALVVRNKLFVANAGDCRAILSRAGKPFPMTKDHVASCPKERERVIKAGTEVKWQIDTWRVGTAALQVTRSIGDDDLKPAVTAQPEVIETALSDDDEFLVMASDGLWDVVSNDDVLSIIKDTVKEPGMCSKRLATEAAERGSKDNITVIVVFLRPVSTAERIY
ncbi:protein kinase and PP2C-like domain-containing protein [Panicum miliaceum]|uniref:Protein kinase and PP2C-like domain-containing protein n=1 Tax=Panicum miliaceum TaxID=4540 RepID=A0A3L6SIV1_PANMI|nr:protein kinase and PP2C-like domain-containing protein [Panicum miliaceum]